MVRRLTAVTLAFALTILSPGLDAGRAFAAVVAPRAVAPVTARIGGAGPVRLPSQGLTGITLPSPAVSPRPTFLPAPGVVAPGEAPRPVFTAQPAAADAPRASVPQMAETLAPALEAASHGRAGASADRGNGAYIEDVITGRKIAVGAHAEVVIPGGSAFTPYGLEAAADAPQSGAVKAAPEAPKPAAVKTVSSRLGYALHRRMLSMVAALTGAVHSMPAAGAALTDRAIAAAADRRVVISDFDDTLAAYNQVLPQEMIDAIAAVKAAGKEFVVISDRGDEKRGHQLTVFESLESLPVSLREGMYVAANAGGRVYRYDAQGVPQRVYEAPALEAEKKNLVADAAEATKRRMKELGAEQHQPSETNNNPSESWNTYGYAMMLKVGSSEAQVRGAAAILQEELAARGIVAEVNPRFAKDPANPPYINFSIITKEPATAYIAKALKATADEVVIVGDSMYAPKEAAKAGSFLDKLGARLAGRSMPKTGNATDRNMEKALPGALVFAVGHNADPRMSNAVVTAVKGPETTRRMLLSVASKRVGAAKDDRGLETALGAVALVGFLAFLGATGYFIFAAIGELIVEAERQLRNMQGLDEFFMLGAAGLAAGSLKVRKNGEKGEPAKKVDEDKPLTRGEKIMVAVFLPVALAGALYLWYMLYAGFTNLPPTPVEIPPGWQGPVPSFRGIEDMFGAAGLGALGVMGTVGVRKMGADLKSLGRRVREFLRPAFPFLAWLGLVGFTAGVYALLAWAFMNAPAAVPAVPTAPGGWESLFQLGAGAGLAGMAGMMFAPKVLNNPGPGYAWAHARAVAIAAERGVPADKVLFVQAAAVMPALETSRWNYEFALPRADGRYDLVYVDAEKFFDTPADYRVSLYNGVSFLAEGAVAKSLEPYYFSTRGTLVNPEAALDAARKAAPGMGARVSVSLRLEQTEDLDAWYRFYDDRGAVAAVNARTGAVRVENAPVAPAVKPGMSLPVKVLLALGAAAVLYALATGHFAAAGLVLGAGALAKKAGAGRAKLTDAEVRATAASVISYKGRPWSSTEFNSVYYPALENLKARGATKRQVALFEKLVADAPIKGGSFNPWSGD
ncbi:MAG: hypothetical protein SF051_00215 [Elusimicrobiota bacterium]|nr:hypothetical protein [Elusimicrobiota bacterium]